MTNLYISPQVPASNSLEDFEKLEWTLLGSVYKLEEAEGDIGEGIEE